MTHPVLHLIIQMLDQSRKAMNGKYSQTLTRAAVTMLSTPNKERIAKYRLPESLWVRL